MDWNAISTTFAVMVPLFTLHAFVMRLMIRNEVSEHDEKIKIWINGSFLRAKEAKTRMDGIERRVENLEDER